MESLTLERLREMRGSDVYDPEGEKVGEVDEVYVDDAGAPEWFYIGTGIFNWKHLIVPVEGASITEGSVRVPYTKERIEEAPDLGSAVDEVDPETEDALYTHFQLPARTETSVPSAGTTPTETEQDVTPGEEAVERRARLRKWVAEDTNGQTR